MTIRVVGASEHNLKGLDVELPPGLTVVTGVSGSGKSSLVFDTIYHESRRRFLETLGTGGLRLSPAKVREVTGLGPAIAVGQNQLNRNPNSTLATATGLHPFLRLLYARFGERRCSRCGNVLSVLSEDAMVDRLQLASKEEEIEVFAPVMKGVRGSHRTLMKLLAGNFREDVIFIDGRHWTGEALDGEEKHDIELKLGTFGKKAGADGIRESIRYARSLGANSVRIIGEDIAEKIGFNRVCSGCGKWYDKMEPTYFRTSCPHCGGKGCGRCSGTGLHPEAAAVKWGGSSFPEMLTKSVHEVRELFLPLQLPSSGERLQEEIERRLEALERVGLGYISLDRPSPSLSRGEAQRARLARSLTGRLEDMLHVLDEPTIGQHPADISRLLPAFRELGGPVIYVEHDRTAAAFADWAVDLGPGAGRKGGELLFSGEIPALWQQDTPTGRYFSLGERVFTPDGRPGPEEFITVRGASLRNLDDIDVPIPLGRFTVVTGVSGSGKSTLVEDVLVLSLREKRPIGCKGIDGRLPKTILVDQSPIGRNPRSNPATYTKLADVIRDIFASKTDLTRSHFSFNRSEGACPECKGTGAKEVRMRYMPSTWIPCHVCGGRRFSEEVLSRKAMFGEREIDIAEFYELSVEEIRELLLKCGDVSRVHLRNAMVILDSMVDIGLGYLSLGQPSPTLSGGEAQRIKLVKFLARRSLSRQLIVLDEPSTGLHPADVSGLLVIFDRLVRNGATILVVEHDRDIVRAADWVIDLGPGAGPEGGRMLYSGPPGGLAGLEGSMTGRALVEEESSCVTTRIEASLKVPGSISIRQARAHNLKNVNVDFPKGALTVVTGVSGSGKSSLVIDVLEAEARRRYLESLSMYERQGLREGPEAPVGAITGLGVTVSIDPGRRLHGRRATVGALTEISHHLSNMLSWLGNRNCPRCGKVMVREGTFECPSCGESIRIPDPGHFISSTYAAACMKCHGVGTTTVPEPDKLIVRPDRPICDGAMYSPGFFPKGYICKPFNGGYYLLQALASRYSFDPAGTPWDEMTEESRHAFLFGDPEPLEVHYESRKGRKSTRRQRFPGFFSWIGDWDFGGTYTRQEVCLDCGGGRLRPEYLAVRLGEFNMAQLSEMPLSDLERAIAGIDTPENREHLVGYSLKMTLRRLRFLIRVGLGYLNLNRLTLTLSAGEAQRIRLASLLGGGLTSLTVLVDEPSRGLHPSEVGALAEALRELVSEGNTAIVVEHDPVLIRAADNIVDMGPGSGSEGGEVVVAGTPEEVSRADTPTGRWLGGKGKFDLSRPRRQPRGWMSILGATENNLKGNEVAIPLGTVTGICGVSGSGKSTLVIDTLGRVLAPRKQTTSVAHEPIRPGEHDSVEGAPERTILVDQVKRGVTSPANFLGLDDAIRSIFADSEDAAASGLGDDDLGRKCTECGGSGVIREDMGFLPTVHSECEACHGTGFPPEIWDVRFRGYSLPEVFSLTIDEVLQVYGDYERLSRPLKAARDVGLGYLMLRQPAFSLSGGEAQRLKISRELSRQSKSETLFILDEPTIGQHMEDIARLAGVLHTLADLGHTVVVIEHQSHLLSSCDWLVELGPRGGPDGGYVIASGTPEDVSRGETPTAGYIRDVLEGGS